jgi:hypothetical protein
MGGWRSVAGHRVVARARNTRFLRLVERDIPKLTSGMGLCNPAAFEYSAFSVDGRTDLSMAVYNPATQADTQKISSLIGSTPISEEI